MQPADLQDDGSRADAEMVKIEETVPESKPSGICGRVSRVLDAVDVVNG